MVFSLVAIGCKTLTEGKPAAEASIVKFHAMLDEAKFAEIYDEADDAMKEKTSQQDMFKLFNAVHTKLGLVKKTSNKTWRAQNYNLTSYVEMVQDTEFEKGSGTEKFTFIMHDKEAVLAGYFIESLDMMTN